MPNKELGIADPVYDALRIRSGQSIAPDLGGGSFGAGGVENKIYVWHADGSSIDLFDADGAGLNLANAAAVSGDTIWLPSISITLSGTLTIAAGRTVTGISWLSALIGTIANSGTLQDCAVTGNITNNAGGRLEGIYLSVTTGTGITQSANAIINKCFIQIGTGVTYGIDITDGYCFHTVIGTDGGTTSTGIYAHGANVEIDMSRFAGHVGGRIEQGYVGNSKFAGAAPSPDASSHGLIHTTTGTARLSNCDFNCWSVNSFGLYITAIGLTLTDCAWNSTNDTSNITFGTGDRSPLNHTHASSAILSVAGNISNPPTEAELESICGVPASVGAGAAFIVRDTSTDRFYLAVSDGSQFLFSPFISSTAGGGGVTEFELVAAGANTAPAWCWFADPRAFYYNGKTYFAYVNSGGDIEVRTYTHSTATISAPFDLHAALQIDDHANPSLLMRDSDKKLLATYSRHNDSTVYLRISTNAEDITAWGAEADLDAALGGTDYTYPSLLQLTGEANDPIYLFYRKDSSKITFSKSINDGVTWASETVLATLVYHKLAVNGTDRIDIAGSDHPLYAGNNGIYHIYYQGGNYYKSDGTLISASLPMAASDMTQVYDGSSVRAWIWDIAIDGTGKPIIVFATFPTQWTDHRYNYARWTGAAWDVHEITAAGGFLYSPETAYSGGVVLDHDDPQIVYLSKQVSGQWEIYKYVTADGGATWSSTAITSGSSGKNIRPVAVRNHASELKFLWLNGTYTSYTNWSLALLGSSQ